MAHPGIAVPGELCTRESKSNGPEGGLGHEAYQGVDRAREVLPPGNGVFGFKRCRNPGLPDNEPNHNGKTKRVADAGGNPRRRSGRGGYQWWRFVCASNGLSITR
ncbi:hypothetical protein L6452_08532 [Arctium lappa]|uniref:Uncharacterized protein n=1 Tax=Arctium lappa TaxID=4217 RepID=A0ACB9DI66_ARCLA|nr:hypothetical protein L6452_08532 [Arctium lappa]